MHIGSSLSSAFGKLVDYGIANLGPSGLSDRKAAAFSYEYQRRLNQNAIQDRVADANAAGVHPVFALGASVQPGSVHVVGNEDRPKLEGMGQDISRAAQAYMTRDERTASKIASGLALEKAQLENDLLRSQIAKETAQLPPGMPGRQSIPGQGDARVVTDSSRDIAHHIGQPGVEATPHDVATKRYFNRDGSVSHYPSDNVAQAIEDNWLYQFEHFMRNRVLPDYIKPTADWLYDRYTKQPDRWGKKFYQ